MQEASKEAIFDLSDTHCKLWHAFLPIRSSEVFEYINNKGSYRIADADQPPSKQPFAFYFRRSNGPFYG